MMIAVSQNKKTHTPICHYLITKTVADLRDASIFARIGKRFIINLNYVYHIEVLKQRLTLSDGEAFSYQLTISKEALKKLKEMYIAYIAGNQSISEIIKETNNDNQ